MLFLYLAYQRAEVFVGVKSVLSALQNEGTKAECVAVITARKNFLFTKSVSFTKPVAFSDTAVKTVVFADVAYFYKTSDIDRVTVYFFSKPHRFITKHRGDVLVIAANECFILIKSEAVLLYKF